MKPYDHLLGLLQEHEEKPFAILMGRRDWRELQADLRTGTATVGIPGDPDLFHGVPVRIKGRRRTPNRFDPLVCATAQDLHDALYPEN